jgi:hypothetical protein
MWFIMIPFWIFMLFVFCSMLYEYLESGCSRIFYSLLQWFCLSCAICVASGCVYLLANCCYN